jgi:hypothetical protein
VLIVIKFDPIIGRCRFTQDQKHRLSVGSPPGREFLEASPRGKLVPRRVRHTASVINGPGPGDTSGNVVGGRDRPCTDMWRSSGCSIGLRSVLGGGLSAVLMRARCALGVAELAERDGLVNGPGCRTITADRQRLLESRGPLRQPVHRRRRRSAR